MELKREELEIKIDKLYVKYQVDPASIRREHLNTSMKILNADGKNCYNCSGICCTYAHNSMLITPLEAIELLVYIIRKNRLDEELIETLEQSVADFRLNKELNLGPGREFRRNYTCPFFSNETLGCSISPKHKPYGCLGFNPTLPGVQEAGSCKVYQEVHDAIEFKDFEQLMKYIKSIDLLIEDLLKVEPKNTNTQ